MMIDGFDSAITGVWLPEMLLVYSVKEIIRILMEDMSEEDAWDYFNFNIDNTYVGEKTPILNYDIL